ncbi:MAG TPA: transcriptional repressor [Acidimicrobiales bacterium]|nr:transcriptional repressor [Acidimicrobiales bacterium]
MTSAPAHVELPDLALRVRRHGWRMSAQRRAVVDVFTGEHIHLTADEILLRARQDLPEISRATVYNTLADLVDMGELLAVSAGDGPKRYDPNVGCPHHHLMCTRCGELKDVVPEGLEALNLSVAELHGYRLIGVDITFRGLCADCRNTTHDA